MKLWYVGISDIPRNMMLSQQAVAARMPVCFDWHDQRFSLMMAKAIKQSFASGAWGRDAVENGLFYLG